MPTLSAFAPPPLLPAVLLPPPVPVVSPPPHAVRASAAVEATTAHFITERKVSPSSKGAPRSRRWELLETTAAGRATRTARARRCPNRYAPHAGRGAGAFRHHQE